MNVNIDNDITKIKIHRSKCFLYKKEQINITKKIFIILNITETNKLFSKFDLDNDLDIQNQILNLLPDIETYFNTTCWHFFYKNTKVNTDDINNIDFTKETLEDNKCLVSLIRRLFKDMKIEFAACNKHKTINNKVYRFTIYNILSDISDFF
jgi:hypothetical protein